MKNFLRYIGTALLCGALAIPMTADAQGRHNGATNGGRAERTHNTNRANNSSHSSRSDNSSRRNNNGSNRPSRTPNGNNGSRPGMSNNSHNNTSRPSIGNNNHGNGNKPDQATRPNNNVKPGNDNGHRPSIGNGNHNNGNKPAQGNTPNNTRPGNNGNRPSIGNGNHNNGNRPSGNIPGNNIHPGNDHGTRPSIGTQRPNQGNSSVRPGNFPGNNRPGHNYQPGGNHGFRPGHNPAPRPPMVTPPHRPYRPVMAHPHYRPMPPRGWRPAGRVPLIRGILGLTFGTAINLSLDYLFNAGYTVDGYTNDMVYLRNVSALNYVWTDAALYYGNTGLDASSFYYSTPAYDLSRYNNVYNSLVTTYGVPVSINNTVNSMSATWFGGNNGYITLSFGANNIGPNLRYLTTLTFGL